MRPPAEAAAASSYDDVGCRMPKASHRHRLLLGRQTVDLGSSMGPARSKVGWSNLNVWATTMVKYARLDPCRLLVLMVTGRGLTFFGDGIQGTRTYGYCIVSP